MIPNPNNSIFLLFLLNHHPSNNAHLCITFSTLPLVMKVNRKNVYFRFIDESYNTHELNNSVHGQASSLSKMTLKK